MKIKKKWVKNLLEENVCNPDLFIENTIVDNNNNNAYKMQKKNRQCKINIKKKNMVSKK